MLKKTLVTFFSIMLLLCIVSCEKKDDVTTENTATVDDKKKESEDKSDKENEEIVADDFSSDTTDNQKEISGLQNINVYFSTDAMSFSKEEVEIDELSAECVLQALIDKSVLTTEVAVQSFEFVEDGEEVSLALDLNQAFSDYISQMGSSGEYYTVGAVCNTFLDAYDCDYIKITVNGNALTTGHTEYSERLGRFE